jgi:hypothetical protein
VNGGDAAHRKDGRRCRLHHGRRIGRNKVRHRASPNTTLASRSGKYSALLSMRESELHTRAHERVNNYKMIPLFLRAAALPPLPQHGSATLASIRQHGRAAGVHPCSPARPAKGETSRLTRTASRLSSRAQRSMSEANGALQTRDPGSPVSRLFRMPGYLGPGSARCREPSGMTIERHQQKSNAIALRPRGRPRAPAAPRAVGQNLFRGLRKPNRVF